MLSMFAHSPVIDIREFEGERQLDPETGGSFTPGDRECKFLAG
jgi:hypothetical protein